MSPQELSGSLRFRDRSGEKLGRKNDGRTPRRAIDVRCGYYDLCKRTICGSGPSILEVNQIKPYW